MSEAMRVAVVIPVFNEERSLPLVLHDLPAALLERIVVVDNGSTDGSMSSARTQGAAMLDGKLEIVREPRRGYGRACLAGLEHLRRTGPPHVVVFLDGDYSDHPDELPLLLAPIESDEADLVIGSRRLGHAEPGALLPQARFGNALATGLIRVLTGFRYTDLGPFRAIRWEALEGLRMGDPDYGWTCEMQMKAIGRLRIVEVPVSYRRRIGVSKITGTVSGTLRAGIKILTWVLRHARQAQLRGANRQPGGGKARNVPDEVPSRAGSSSDGYPM
ncbi:MAG: glycosyltransferase family 2 protein [Thermoanaerobaculia bacterium]